MDEKIFPHLEEKRIEEPSRKDYGVVTSRFAFFARSTSDFFVPQSKFYWIPRVSTHPMAFILFTVNCRPLEASPTESRAACESGRDLKTFQSRLKPYLWPNRPEKSEPLRRIWWVSTGRSAWMPAWSRSTLDPETRIPKFSSTTWTASFAGLLRNFVSSAYILTTTEMKSLDWSSKRSWLQKRGLKIVSNSDVSGGFSNLSWDSSDLFRFRSSVACSY